MTGGTTSWRHSTSASSRFSSLMTFSSWYLQNETVFQTTEAQRAMATVGGRDHPLSIFQVTIRSVGLGAGPAPSGLRRSRSTFTVQGVSEGAQSSSSSAFTVSPGRGNVLTSRLPIQ